MRSTNAHIKCSDCDRPLTWAIQCKQLARLIERGFTADQAKQSGTRCQKCTTQWARANGR